MPASAELLSRLASTENTVTALISGRDLASLRAVANPPTETLLVGSHGTERWAPESFGIDATHIDLNVKQSAALDKATKVLEIGRLRQPRHQPRIQARLGGPACAPGSPGGRFQGATCRPTKSWRTSKDLWTLDGKAVLEATVLSGTKGEGLDWLREVADASTVLFAGDDVTDEDAFAVLRPGDIGVKIGSGNTRAQFRLNGPGELSTLLEAVLDMRSL